MSPRRHRHNTIASSNPRSGIGSTVAAGTGRRRIGSFLALLFLTSLSGPLPSFPGELPNLLEYRVTEQAPVIEGRHDKAFHQALEGAFRRAILEALREVGGHQENTRDFAAWQRAIFSRAADFIFSYRILAQEEKEGYLTLSVETGVYRDKLERAVADSASLSPSLPVRLLVIVDTFPLAGAPGEEDIDAGHLASSALEMEFLRRGAIILSSPEGLPWQHLEGRSTAENRISLATVEGENQGADYVLLGELRSRADKLLILSVELISVTSQKTVASARSPVEMQADSLPQQSFIRPAEELARSLTPKISGPSPGRLR